MIYHRRADAWSCTNYFVFAERNIFIDVIRERLNGDFWMTIGFVAAQRGHCYCRDKFSHLTAAG
jgi:hypothetical protein